MKIKTAELTGPALDWAVAKCEDLEVWREPDGIYLCEGGEVGFMFRPSTSWQEGGPIIEREEISSYHEIPAMRDSIWQARPSLSAKGAGGRWGIGPTPLIAAMRCYVASKLGEEIDIPEELG